MTYFNLRKRGPAPETETVEADDEHAEAEVPDDETSDPPPGPVGALWAGVSGPGRWLTARGQPGMAWLLYAGSAWAVGFYGGGIAVGLVLAWLLAILLFIPRGDLERLAAWVEYRTTGGPEVPAEDPGEAPVDTLVAVLRRLIGDAPGVHLKTLAEHLQAAAPEEALDRAAVRAKLAALHLPTRASVRDASGRVNEGVHRADLVAWLKALPSPAPGTPPEARSSPVATALTCDVAEVPTPVATPLSRVRRLLSRGAV